RYSAASATDDPVPLPIAAPPPSVAYGANAFPAPNRRLRRKVSVVSRKLQAAVEPLARTSTDANGPVARSSAKALSRLERVDSTAAASASSARARLLFVSTPNSIAQCGAVFRRTRTPNDPACGTPGRTSAASSGTTRPARPNYAVTAVSSDPPSP